MICRADEMMVDIFNEFRSCEWELTLTLIIMLEPHTEW